MLFLTTIRESFSIIAIDHYTYNIKILLQLVTRRYVIYYVPISIQYDNITRVLNMPNITAVIEII